MEDIVIDDVVFQTFLDDLSYDDALAMFYTTESRKRKALIPQSCAKKISGYLARKNTLDSIREIKAYVQELPLWKQRMDQINILIKEFKTQ